MAFFRTLFCSYRMFASSPQCHRVPEARSSDPESQGPPDASLDSLLACKIRAKSETWTHIEITSMLRKHMLTRLRAQVWTSAWPWSTQDCLRLQ